MIDRSLIPRRVAEALKSDLGAGLWRGMLPGGRVLAAHYGVSRPTCEAALRILADEGWIIHGGARRCWRIVNEASSTTPGHSASEPGVLLWVSDEDPVTSDRDSREIFNEIKRDWDRRGGRTEIVQFDMIRTRTPKAALATLVSRHAASRLILHNPPIAVSRAAMSVGAPVFMLGGEVEGLVVDGAGFSLGLVLGEIIPRLIAAGRQRIMVIIPAKREAWRQSAMECIKGSGSECSRDPASWVIEVEHHFPEAMHDLWRRLLPAKRPDAVFLNDTSWLVSLYSVAWQMGLRPGSDMEILTSDSRSITEWLDPPPRILRFPLKRTIKRIRRWLNHPDKIEGFEILGLDE